MWESLQMFPDQYNMQDNNVVKILFSLYPPDDLVLYCFKHIIPWTRIYIVVLVLLSLIYL